jgi:hypothetical protein
MVLPALAAAFDPGAQRMGSYVYLTAPTLEDATRSLDALGLDSYRETALHEQPCLCLYLPTPSSEGDGWYHTLYIGTRPLSAWGK